MQATSSAVTRNHSFAISRRQAQPSDAQNLLVSSLDAPEGCEALFHDSDFMNEFLNMLKAWNQTMALDPLELIIIGVIVVVVLLWGPKKIPELARSLGLARKEFDQAKKVMQNPGTSLTDSMTQGVQGQAPPSSSDELLLQTARRLGINTQGKTKEQISEEIVARGKDPYGP